MWQRIATGFIALASSTSIVLSQPPDAATGDARVQWQRMIEYLESLPAYTFDLTSRNVTTADGLLMDYSMRYAVSIERPGRYALRWTGGMKGPEYISDGANLTIHLPVAQQYQVIDAPPNAIDALDPDRLGYLGEFYGSFLADAPGMRTLLSELPAESAAALAEQLVYVGLEAIDGVDAHHLRVDNSARAHDVWIAAGDPPRPVRFSFEPESPMWDASDYWEEPKNVTSITLTNWNGSPVLTDELFAFAAPEGSEQVDDLSEAMFNMDMGETAGGEAELLGTPAPEFELESLEGTKVQLAGLREGGRIVVLDFWATWCPPCREGLPVITETMANYPEDKAVFYAINVMEDAKTVRTFLDDQKLDIHVLLDSEGTVGDLYGVTGIPQTVVIGADGTIQSIHVGFMPGVGDQLKEEIDTLLAGESLVEARERRSAEALELADMEQLWSVPGNWQSVAADPSGVEVAVGFKGNRLAKVSADGKVLSEVPAQCSAGVLRLARLVPGAVDPAAVVFSQWGQTVEAVAADGSSLWDYNLGDGVDDVWAADLDGDDLDEVIIGYNGFTGLHVLSNEGELRWKNTSIGNVWHVTAADVDGDGLPEVITTSAEGKVHIFDKDGKRMKNFSPGVYANMVRAVSPGNGAGGAIYVGGSARNGSEAVVKMSIDGQRMWSVDLPGETSASIDAMAVNGSAALLAVTTRSGSLYLLDTDAGEILAQYPGVEPLSQIAWINGDGSRPTLLLTSRTGLTAIARSVDE